MRAWKDVASLVKPRNLNGRFVARPAAGLPFVLEEGMEVAFVPPQTDLPRRGTVSFVRELSDGLFEVGFDSVTDESSAHGLAGCHCLVRRADVEDVLADDLPVLWLGWNVLDVQGNLLGVVSDLVDGPGQSLLVVQRDGGRPDAYIPVVDEFIAQVDADACKVVVDIPEGLLTLND